MIKNFDQFKNESSESKGSELLFTFEEFSADIESDEDPGLWDDIKKKATQIKDKVVKAITPDTPNDDRVTKTPQDTKNVDSKGGLTDYLKAIAFKECSGIPTKINSSGYMGKYQFSGISLNDILKIKPNETFIQYKKRIESFMPSNFGDIKKFYEGSRKRNKSLSSKDVAYFRTQFRKKGLSFWPEKKQDKAMIQLLKNNFDYLGEFTNKYKNVVKNRVKLTISGMLAGAHLLGPKAVKDFISKGIVGKDGNGTPITEYIKKFGGYKFFLP